MLLEEFNENILKSVISKKPKKVIIDEFVYYEIYTRNIVSGKSNICHTQG